MATSPFSTPVAGLALEMALRNQQAIDALPGMTAADRAEINRRLKQYGGDLSQYEQGMTLGYDPAVQALRSQAESMRDYLIGLPELMARAAKEGVGTSGSVSQSPDTTALQNYWQRQYNNLMAAYAPKTTVPTTVGSTFGTADTKSEWAKAPTASRLRATSMRRTGGGPKVTFQ